MLNNPREVIRKLRKDAQIYAGFSLIAFAIFVLICADGFKQPQLIHNLKNFSLLAVEFCGSVLGFMYTAVKAYHFADQARILELGLNVGNPPNNHLINEQMPEVNTFSRRLQNIEFQEVRDKYTDPLTKKIMNYPYLIGCHRGHGQNVDYPTYQTLKGQDEANRLCLHPGCNGALIFSAEERKDRNERLKLKIESYVAFQENKFHFSRVFSPDGLKRELERRKKLEGAQSAAPRDEDRKSSRDTFGPALGLAAAVSTDSTHGTQPVADPAIVSDLNIPGSDVTINIEAVSKVKASMS